jgi:hypothetical protein
MYFRSSIRRNPATDQIDSYYRLVESYRNETDRVCHRTLLNVGFLNGMITIDELNQVRRIICKRYQDIKGGDELFDIEDKIYLYDLTNTYFEGNMQDSKTLEEIILNLRSLTSTSMRAVVVIDAGIMNTRKSVLTVSQNRYDEVILSRRCSEPTPQVEAIYRRLKYKSQPFTKRKFVVHKSEFEKMDLADLQRFLI